METVVQLIGATSIKSGLKAKAKKDTKEYESGIKVSAKEMEELNLNRHKFHGEWDYTINPNQ